MKSLQMNPLQERNIAVFVLAGYLWVGCSQLTIVSGYL